LELYEKIAKYFENRDELSEEDIAEVENLTEEELVEQFRNLTINQNPDGENWDNSTNQVFVQQLKNNMKSLMLDGRPWLIDDIKEKLGVAFQDDNSDWTLQCVSEAISLLLEEEPNLIEVSEGVYQYRVNDKFRSCIQNIITAKNRVISIGEDINPIIASEIDMNNILELKKVVQKLNECKKILERLK
jgi:hypothetical protein